jgi:RNA polymerase Rpb2, domain 6/RNA polymerase Rpb2, domain 7/RNA polymerase Rpb2, domain 3
MIRIQIGCKIDNIKHTHIPMTSIPKSDTIKSAWMNEVAPDAHVTRDLIKYTLDRLPEILMNPLRVSFILALQNTPEEKRPSMVLQRVRIIPPKSIDMAGTLELAFRTMSTVIATVIADVCVIWPGSSKYEVLQESHVLGTIPWYVPMQTLREKEGSVPHRGGWYVIHGVPYGILCLQTPALGEITVSESDSPRVVSQSYSVGGIPHPINGPHRYHTMGCVVDHRKQRQSGHYSPDTVRLVAFQRIPCAQGVLVRQKTVCTLIDLIWLCHNIQFENPMNLQRTRMIFSLLTPASIVALNLECLLSLSGGRWLEKQKRSTGWESTDTATVSLLDVFFGKNLYGQEQLAIAIQHAFELVNLAMLKDSNVTRDGFTPPIDATLRVLMPSEVVHDRILLSVIGFRKRFKSMMVYHNIKGRQMKDIQTLTPDEQSVVYIALRQAAIDVAQRLIGCLSRDMMFALTGKKLSSISAGLTCTQTQAMVQVIASNSSNGDVTAVRRLLSNTTTIKGRHAHVTEWGMVCPFDTPDSIMCGVQRALAIMALPVPTGKAHWSGHLDEEIIETVIIPLNCTDWPDPSGGDGSSSGVRVWWNGRFIGWTTLQLARLCHRKSPLQGQLLCPWIAHWSCVYVVARHCLVIRSLSGRFVRIVGDTLSLYANTTIPLLPPKIRTIESDPVSLFCEKYGMRLVDLYEQDEHIIGRHFDDRSCDGGTLKHRLYEPFAGSYMGISALSTPFANHNQAPRISYAAHMQRQATVLLRGNVFRTHGATGPLYSQVTVQKPLVTTGIVPWMDECTGINVLIGHQCLGDNQEDGLVINRDAIDRGIFDSEHWFTYFHPERNATVLCKIGDRVTRGMRIINGSMVTDDNDIATTEEIEEEEKETRNLYEEPVIIDMDESDNTKQAPIVGFSDRAKKENEDDDEDEGGQASTIPVDDETNGIEINRTIFSRAVSGNAAFIRVNSKEQGRVTAIYRDPVRVVILRTHRPTVGDKLASRHGQKGVICSIWDAADLPLFEDGTTCDIFINPHAFPSRMTIGQLHEAMVGTTALEHSCIKNGSSHTTPEHPSDTSLLDGESASDGRTGEPYSTPVFRGYVLYQALRHYVEYKMQCVRRATRDPLTRQPVRGKHSNGAIRMGEMERDALIAHGAIATIHDKFMTCSDAVTVTVCDMCGLIVSKNIGCLSCNPRRVARRVVDGKFTITMEPSRVEKGVSSVEMPYCFKLLCQELQSMNIALRIKTKSKFET